MSALPSFYRLPEANPIPQKGLSSPQGLHLLSPLPHWTYTTYQQPLLPPSDSLVPDLILPEGGFAQIFAKPLYIRHQGYLRTNDASYGSIYAKPTSQPALSVQTQQMEGLQFDSRFEGGNLAFAAFAEQHSNYYLLLQKDINTRRSTQWFFFKVGNGKNVGQFGFHIINFTKDYSAFRHGMQPVCCFASEDYCWRRGGIEVIYRRTNLCYETNLNYYALSFKLPILRQDDTVYLAYCYPYSYAQMDRHIFDLSRMNSNIVKRRTLAITPLGNSVDLITITNPSVPAAHKRTVFISARVHPGETPSSFVAEGLVDFLSSSTEQAQMLRETFVFKVAPMINPDGVICGNYRCAFAGYDMNRAWNRNRKQKLSELHGLKQALAQSKNLLLYVDLHAHSKKRGVFMYGCQDKASPQICRQIPYLMHKKIEGFNYYQCNFSMTSTREGTSRIYINRHFNLPYSYTMEHSFFASTKGKVHFRVCDFRIIGRDFGAALCSYYCRKTESNLFQELSGNKDLIKVGNSAEASDSESEIDQFENELDSPERLSMKDAMSSRYISRQSPSLKSRYQQSGLSEERSKLQFKLLPEHSRPSARGTRPAAISCSDQRLPSMRVPVVPPQMEVDFISSTCVQITPRQELIRPSQLEVLLPPMTIRNECFERTATNNLFLPSLATSAYKKYLKGRVSQQKQIIQSSRLVQVGLIKKEISHVKKRVALGDRAKSLL